MKFIIAFLLFGIFLFLAGIHFYWGMGGKWGVQTAVPTDTAGTKVLNPGPLACLVVAIGLLCCGLLVLIKCGILVAGLPHWLSRYGLWALSVLFLLRAIGDFRYVGFFKKITTTPFARLDTYYYSPLCLIIAGLLLCLQLLSK